MQKCPFCAGEIQDSATKCKHCKKWLTDFNEPKKFGDLGELCPDGNCTGRINPVTNLCSKCGKSKAEDLGRVQPRRRRRWPRVDLERQNARTNNSSVDQQPQLHQGTSSTSKTVKLLAGVIIFIAVVTIWYPDDDVIDKKNDPKNTSQSNNGSSERTIEHMLAGIHKGNPALDKNDPLVTRFRRILNRLDEKCPEHSREA